MHRSSFNGNRTVLSTISTGVDGTKCENNRSCAVAPSLLLVLTFATGNVLDENIVGKIVHGRFPGRYFNPVHPDRLDLYADRAVSLNGDDTTEAGHSVIVKHVVNARFVFTGHAETDLETSTSSQISNALLIMYTSYFLRKATYNVSAHMYIV